MTPKKTTDFRDPRITVITPQDAMQLLESNASNRPLNEQHVKRIANQILSGKWRFNGDTIKVSSANDILDGQHRLWAIIEAKQEVETIIVRGIDPDAFSTIDTLRKPRSGSDVLALMKVTHHRSTISMALQWLIRWQRRCLETYKQPSNRIENSDIEEAYRNNPGMARAAERVGVIRSLGSGSLMAFFYYVLTNRNPDLAERMIATLENPAGVGVTDPFFKLRMYMLSSDKKKEALTTIALMIKAANAAHGGREIKALAWNSQGKIAEPFPTLDVGHHPVNVR